MVSMSVEVVENSTPAPSPRFDQAISTPVDIRLQRMAVPMSFITNPTLDPLDAAVRAFGEEILQRGPTDPGIQTGSASLARAFYTAVNQFMKVQSDDYEAARREYWAAMTNAEKTALLTYLNPGYTQEEAKELFNDATRRNVDYLKHQKIDEVYNKAFRVLGNPANYDKIDQWLEDHKDKFPSPLVAKPLAKGVTTGRQVTSTNHTSFVKAYEVSRSTGNSPRGGGRGGGMDEID